MFHLFIVKVYNSNVNERKSRKVALFENKENLCTLNTSQINIKMKKQNRKYNGNKKENLCTLNKKTGLVTNTKKRVKKYNNGNKKNIFIIIYICTLVTITFIHVFSA